MAQHRPHPPAGEGHRPPPGQPRRPLRGAHHLRHRPRGARPALRHRLIEATPRAWLGAQPSVRGRSGEDCEVVPRASRLDRPRQPARELSPPAPPHIKHNVGYPLLLRVAHVALKGYHDSFMESGYLTLRIVFFGLIINLLIGIIITSEHTLLYRPPFCLEPICILKKLDIRLLDS